MDPNKGCSYTEGSNQNPGFCMSWPHCICWTISTNWEQCEQLQNMINETEGVCVLENWNHDISMNLEKQLLIKDQFDSVREQQFLLQDPYDSSEGILLENN